MLSHRLQRAQYELCSHRKWLQRFVTGRYIRNEESEGRCHPNRTLATGSVSTLLQKGHDRKPIRGKPKSQWQKNRKWEAQANQSLNFNELGHREALLTAIQAYSVKGAISAYAELPDKKPLTPEEFRALAQCVLQSLRIENLKSKEDGHCDTRDEIVGFATQLVKDVRRGRLLPDVQANILIMAIFKESGVRDQGIKFWQWLQEQDEQYVGCNTYAVAIDILAVDGCPLETLEELYETALSRFPGNFHAYHLSPAAILTNREEAIEIPDLPMQLLQSITHARLLHADSTRAYLALDTALRLFPTSVHPRLLGIFQEERPVAEFYTVFALACRAGVPLPSKFLRTLIAQLRMSLNDSPAEAYFISLRVMLAAIYLQLGGGGAAPTSNVISEVIITATQIMRVGGVASLPSDFRKKIVDSLLGFIRTSIEVFARFNVTPLRSAFNSIIMNIAGYGQAKKVIGTALLDMEGLGIEPDAVTRRSLLAAAGLIKDKDLVETSWREIVAARESEGQSPDSTDFSVFIKAARLVDDSAWAESEFETYKHKLSDSVVPYLQSQFTRDLMEAAVLVKPILDVEGFFKSVEKLNADIAALEEASRNLPLGIDFSSHKIPMFLLPTVFTQGQNSMPSEDEVRETYNSFTTEIRASQNPDELLQIQTVVDTDKAPFTKPAKLPTSPTNLSFEVLRFENWKAINYLMFLADKHDREHDQMVDTALAQNLRPPSRRIGFANEELEEMRSFGISSDELFASKCSDVGSPAEEIFRLRGKPEWLDTNKS